MKVEVAVLGSPVPNGPYGLCGRKATLNVKLRITFTISMFMLAQCFEPQGRRFTDFHAAAAAAADLLLSRY